MPGSRATGFSVTETILVVVIIGLLAFGLWSWYQSNQDREAAQSRAISTPNIEATEDLGRAEQFLQDVDIQGTLETDALEVSSENTQ